MRRSDSDEYLIKAAVEWKPTGKTKRASKEAMNRWNNKAGLKKIRDTLNWEEKVIN